MGIEGVVAAATGTREGEVRDREGRLGFRARGLGLQEQMGRPEFLAGLLSLFLPPLNLFHIQKSKERRGEKRNGWTKNLGMGIIFPDSQKYEELDKMA